jgi:hypothetical protein
MDCSTAQRCLASPLHELFGDSPFDVLVFDGRTEASVLVMRRQLSEQAANSPLGGAQSGFGDFVCRRHDVNLSALTL